jgi:transposase InsO family protein
MGPLFVVLPHPLRTDLAHLIQRLEHVGVEHLMAERSIKSFNGRLRDECLNVHQFTSMAEAHDILEAWRLDYNQRRPHSSLGHRTPNEFVAQRQVEQTVEEIRCSR